MEKTAASRVKIVRTVIMLKDAKNVWTVFTVIFANLNVQTNVNMVNAIGN